MRNCCQLNYCHLLLHSALLVFCLAPSLAYSQMGALTLTPEAIESGSPELIRVDAPATAVLEGDWLGRKLEFFRGRDGDAWYALAGVDVEAPAGPSLLTITIQDAKGAHGTLSRTVQIYPAHYRTSSLSVAPKFVEPGPEALAQIEAEQKLKASVFAASSPEPLWKGNFRRPVSSAPTDSFGVRRIFNGKLASIHKGMDFCAATGAPVRAGNSGVVVLARPLYCKRPEFPS